MNVSFDKACEDLSLYLFDVCGVPGASKRVAFISHEHLDHVPLVVDLAAQEGIEIYSSTEVFRILEKKIHYWSNLEALNLKLKETIMLYRPGVKFAFDDVTMIRGEHAFSEAFFIFHHGKVLYMSEASGAFIRKHIESLVRELQPEYVVMSTPSHIHGVYPEDVEYANRFGGNVALTATFLEGQPMLSEEVTSRFRLRLPRGCLVLPKVVRSYLDISLPL
jgi:hypothetical protein